MSTATFTNFSAIMCLTRKVTSIRRLQSTFRINSARRLADLSRKTRCSFLDHTKAIDCARAFRQGKSSFQLLAQMANQVEKQVGIFLPGRRLPGISLIRILRVFWPVVEQVAQQLLLYRRVSKPLLHSVEGRLPPAPPTLLFSRPT